VGVIDFDASVINGPDAENAVLGVGIIAGVVFFVGVGVIGVDAAARAGDEELAHGLERRSEFGLVGQKREGVGLHGHAVGVIELGIAEKFDEVFHVGRGEVKIFITREAVHIKEAVDAHQECALIFVGVFAGLFELGEFFFAEFEEGFGAAIHGYEDTFIGER